MGMESTLRHLKVVFVWGAHTQKKTNRRKTIPGRATTHPDMSLKHILIKSIAYVTLPSCALFWAQGADLGGLVGRILNYF